MQILKIPFEPSYYLSLQIKYKKIRFDGSYNIKPNSLMIFHHGILSGMLKYRSKLGTRAVLNA